MVGLVGVAIAEDFAGVVKMRRVKFPLTLVLVQGDIGLKVIFESYSFVEHARLVLIKPVNIGAEVDINFSD